MGGRVSSASRERASAAAARAATAALGERDDAHEREADRAAEAVLTSSSVTGSAISLGTLPLLQREEKAPAAQKSEEEKYKDAARKAGEAFLQTAPGKEIAEKAERLGDAFISTLPGKVITGAAVAGAVTALAATHRELPVGIPEIPLDRIKPGLRMKITYEGPVDRPTKVTATFSLPLGGAGTTRRTPAPSKSEQYRAETAKLASELATFREGLKSPEERERDRRLLETWMASRLTTPTGSPLSFEPSPRVPGLGPRLPLTERKTPESGASALTLTGETQERPPEEETKKKDEEPVQRKAARNTTVAVTPPIVGETLRTSGEPLDAGTRAHMEARFGFDFARVRIHTDAQASRSADAVDALAYTVGDDVVFASGRYSPRTAEGQRLIAHELAHVVQQSGGGAATTLTPGPARLARQQSASTSAPDPLQVALNGDDDAVRALTRRSDWEFRVVRPEQAAILLGHLLDGATVDDDERAGLAILEKAIHQLLIDQTLVALDRRGQFEQLLDDFDGAEYRTLLRLLSENIQRKETGALYLDAFIAMWWVREHEETAIVVLLERMSQEDQLALLTEKNRLSKLREAIDSDDPRRRYETVVADVNEAHGDQLATRVSAVLEIDARASAAKGQRTEAETRRLLERAAADVAAELLDYRQRLDEAIGQPKANVKAITEINQAFEKRLNGLLAQKKAEFGLELRYNIEFNRMLRNAYGRPWTVQDLRNFDEILKKIPADILRANPGFQGFQRGASYPGLGGQSSREGWIYLYGELDLERTLHELGHQFVYPDAMGVNRRDPLEVPIFRAFAALSGWERLTRFDIILGATDDAERRRLSALIDTLDVHRAKGDKYARTEHGGWFYRYNRYPLQTEVDNATPTYYRYRKDAKFVRDYAATDPQEDFSDSFATYLARPKTLQEKVPEKYGFMHVQVFVTERLRRQAAPVLARFDERVQQRLAGLRPEFVTAVRTAHVDALRLELDIALSRQSTQKGAEAARTVKDTPRPIERGAAAERLAEPFLRRLDTLLNVLQRAASVPEPSADLQRELDIDARLASTYRDLTEDLVNRYRQELLRVVDAPARRARRGEAVDARTWPELDALQARYRQAFDIVPPYLPLYQRAFQITVRFTDFAKDINARFRKSPRREQIVAHVLGARDARFWPEVEAWKAGVITRIRDGLPFDPRQVVDPTTILTRYERELTADAARIAAQRSARGEAAPVDGAAAVQAGVDSPGQPLDPNTKEFMEGRFGQDFGDVRVHRGQQASDSAHALDAKAFTVGQDIVFGESAFEPGTGAGRELLAHELTHVVQQRGATPGSDTTDRALPPLSFEAVDLPQSDAPNEDASAAIAPAATAMEGPPSELPTEPPIDIEAEPAQGENAVAATPTDGAAGSSPVVPRSHPSEQEAERVARAVAGPESGHGPLNAPAIQRSHGPGVHRQAAFKRAQAQGIDVVFIMGVDKNPKKNPFYREAVKYFKATQPTATLVNDDKHRSLESVFDYLRDRGERVANLYLVSHANEDGTLSFKLRTSDKSKDPHVQYGDLVKALAKDKAIFDLPKGVIDQDTRISIKGCNIGRSTRMLDALDQAFGGEGTVTAPTHKQVFGTRSVGPRKDRKVEHYEALQVYFIEYKGNQKITPEDQQAAFIAKYPELPESQWKKWVPVGKKGKGGATRQPISISYTYRYSVNVKNKATKRMAEEEALPEAIGWGEANIGRPEMFEWRIASSKQTGYGWLVTAVAEKTNYVVSKILVDAEGKHLKPPETDPKYFGTSTFGDDAKKAAQQAAAGGGADTAALMAELASVTQAAADLDEGPERDEKLVRKREIEAALAQRSALVDVSLVKTEDWLGADEVYVAVSGGQAQFQSPVKRLNDGQSHTFAVPLTALMPFDRPVRLEVYDEDLGVFFDRDDLIVRMEWAPPFGPATNKESLDEADYRVRARL